MYRCPSYVLVVVSIWPPESRATPKSARNPHYFVLALSRPPSVEPSTHASIPVQAYQQRDHHYARHLFQIDVNPCSSTNCTNGSDTRDHPLMPSQTAIPYLNALSSWGRPTHLPIASRDFSSTRRPTPVSCADTSEQT